MSDRIASRERPDGGAGMDNIFNEFAKWYAGRLDESTRNIFSRVVMPREKRVYGR